VLFIIIFFFVCYLMVNKDEYITKSNYNKIENFGLQHKKIFT